MERECCQKCREAAELRNERAWYSRTMITCGRCGNKRCPKAVDHTHACTNSNEPGQVGTVGEDAPLDESSGEDESTSELRALAHGLQRSGSPTTAAALVRAADRMEALEAVARAAERACVDLGCGGDDEMGCQRDDGPTPHDWWCPVCLLSEALAALSEARR